jgi:hypothetical protein
LGNGVSITGQLLGKGDTDFDTTVSWAYISYDIDASNTIQAGRMGYPIYYFSDFMNVRYAYHWLRSPADTYTLPPTEYEGIKYTHRYTLSDWDGTLQLFSGSGISDMYGFPGELPVKWDNAYGGIMTFGNDWLQFRAVALNQDTYMAGEGIIPSEKDTASDTDFMGFALKADLGNLTLMAEYTRFDFHSPLTILPTVVSPLSAPLVLHQGISSYITAAYRIGDLTPHITYSQRDTDLEVISVFDDVNAKNNTVTVGLRWDFHSNAALKFEYNTSSDDSNDSSKLISGDAYDVDTAAIGVDLVF